MKTIPAALVLCSVLLASASVAAGAEVIESSELRKAFADDSKAAETRYLGKTILVNGIVLATGMSVYMTPNVTLSDREGGEVQVICVLPRLDAGKLADFTPGRRVTMSGKVYRLSERGVVLKECKAEAGQKKE